MNVDAAIDELLSAACSADIGRARAILAAAPALAVADIAVAALLGRDEIVAGMLEHDPSLATRKRGPDDVEPLVYLCFSRFNGIGEYADGVLRAARLLLDGGADPNASYVDPDAPGGRLPALYGVTGVTDNPAIAAMLLAAWADPNDGESI